MAPALPDDLSKLTVAKLKDALKKRGLDVAGLKADLVARLQSAVDAENKAGPGSPKSPPTSKSPRQSKGAGDEDGKSPRTSTREPSRPLDQWFASRDERSPSVRQSPSVASHALLDSLRNIQSSTTL